MVATATARRLVGYIFTSFHLEPTRLYLFMQHVRSILEFCAPVASLFSKGDQLALESVPRLFIRLLFSHIPTLRYRERCRRLKLDPLWLRRARLNLCYLIRLTQGSAQVATTFPQFAEQCKYDLRS